MRYLGWAGTAFLIVSMVALGQGWPHLGWACSFFGNACYLARSAQRPRDWELGLISAIGMVIAGYYATH